MPRKHHQLIVWRDAVALVKLLYAVTREFPAHEKFGLTAQLRRAAVSVPANVAEGAARQTDKEFLHFLVMARGSLAEIETHVVIARELGYCAPDADLDRAVENLFGKLGSLIRSLQQRNASRKPA